MKSCMSLDKAAREVLRHYPLAGLQVEALGQPGFSGASIWRVTALSAPFCLRAWPAGGPTASDIASAHRLMKAAERLPFVPRVVPGRHYQTMFTHAERLWDLTTWMPGTADFAQQPQVRRIQAAGTALAALHLAWVGVSPSQGPCPAIARRLQRLQAWTALVERGWKPALSTNDIDQLAERAWRQLDTRIHAIPEKLARWAAIAVPLQPCLCDIWHDHVLFTGDDVTGIIDYGSVKVDNVAVDLARMLGSMVGDKGALREAGLAAYERVRPLAAGEKGLINVLDETGTILGTANWLRWLYFEKRAYANRGGVVTRLGALVRRMEGWG